MYKLGINLFIPMKKHIVSLTEKQKKELQKLLSIERKKILPFL